MFQERGQKYSLLPELSSPRLKVELILHIRVRPGPLAALRGCGRLLVGKGPGRLPLSGLLGLGLRDLKRL